MIELILPPKPKMTVNGISAYRLYLMLKRHFTGSYDVVKYRWSINVSEKSFVKNRNRFLFERLAKKFTLGELSAIMTINFVANPDAWGGNIADSDAVSYYRKTSGKFDIMNKVFKEEIELMLDFGKLKDIRFKDLLYSTNGQPWIFKFVQTNTISYETMILLDSLFNFVDTYDKLNDHVWANGYADRIKAYRKLCNINREQAKACFTKTVREYQTMK